MRRLTADRDFGPTQRTKNVRGRSGERLKATAVARARAQSIGASDRFARVRLCRQQERTRETLDRIGSRRLLAAAALAPAHAADISGAGATFPYPIYAKWADAYKKETGIGLNYQSIGSGGGIKQIKAKTVTFGASDAPLPGKELDEAASPSSRW